MHSGEILLSGCSALFNEILAFINENVGKKLTLDKITQVCFLSKSHLCRVFKAHMALTVIKYVARRRIELVKQRYSEGISLDTASLRAGFEGCSSFCRTYKKQIYHPPGEDLSNKGGIAFEEYTGCPFGNEYSK